MRTLLMLLSFGVGAAYADDPMRCGSSLITSDNTVDDLLAKCGEPQSREVKIEDIKAGGATGASRTVGQTKIETWTYQRSSQSVPRVITIVDGKIKRIETKS